MPVCDACVCLHLTAHSSVWLYMAVLGVWLCVSIASCLWLCVAVYGCAWRSVAVAVCGGVALCMPVCVAVWLCVAA